MRKEELMMKAKKAPILCSVSIVLFFLFNLTFGLSLFAAQPRVIEKEKFGGTLTIAIPYDFKSLDSRYLPGSGSESFGQQSLYERMAQYDSVGARAIVPVLAEKWKQTDDKTWLVQIRKGVKFHNGKEMTAQDVWQNIDWKVNRAKYTKEKKWRPPRVRTAVNHIKSVEAVDKYTLKFVLDIPFGPFPNWTMNWAVQGVTDPEVVEKYGRETTLAPVGTGPFKFVEWVPGAYAVIERFDDYWGKKAYLDKVIFRVIPDGQTRLIALQKGEVDVALDLPLNAISTLKKDPNVKYFVMEDSTRTRGGVVYFNLRQWPMSDVKFRQAVLMGADWTGIAKKIFPEGTFVPRRTLLKNTWAENKDAEKLAPSYNPQKAKELVKQLEKESGKPLPVVSGFVQNAHLISTIMQFAADQLKQVGIKMDVKVLEHTVLLDTYRRNPKCPWDVMLHNMKACGIDPYTGFYELSAESTDSGDGKNIPGYNDPVYDDLLKKSVSTTDRKVRTKIYHELERMALQQSIAVPFYTIAQLVGYRKEVHDLRAHDSYFIYLHTPWNNVWKEK